jgi:hypothetical protein
LEGSTQSGAIGAGRTGTLGSGAGGECASGTGCGTGGPGAAAGGNLVAVVAEGALGFYAADTGKPVWKKPLAQVSGTKPSALTLARGAPDVLQLSPAGDVLLVQTGEDELLLRLVR